LNNSLKEFKQILLKIKDSSETISGGSGKEERFVMRDPNLYWDLGLAVQKICNQNDIPEGDRRGWIREYFRDIEEAVWPGNHPFSVHAYNYVYEFMDKKTYLLVADLAGHKFRKLRRKRIDYLRTAFSRRNPQLSPEKQKLLIQKLSERDYAHDEFLKTIQNIKGKTKIPTEKIQEVFEEFLTEVQRLMKSSPEDRTIFRSNIGLELLDQIRFALQLLRMQDPAKFKRAYDSVKIKLSKDHTSKSELALKLFHYFRECLGNKEKTELLLETVDSSEMSSLNNLLNALKSEDNYRDYEAKREALTKIFND
jgi:hypothetical protein